MVPVVVLVPAVFAVPTVAVVGAVEEEAVEEAVEEAAEEAAEDAAEEAAEEAVSCCCAVEYTNSFYILPSFSVYLFCYSFLASTLMFVGDDDHDTVVVCVASSSIYEHREVDEVNGTNGLLPPARDCFPKLEPCLK